MSRNINWGIIGLGKIANKFASDLLLYPNANLLGVASRNLDTAKIFGQKYQAKKYYDSYEALAMDDEIDIIYIATPHTFHYANTMMCLANGKSVLCEKPMGVDAAEVKAMVREAKARNLFLMEGLWTRFLPATQKVLELIENKVLGNINCIRADFGFMGNTDPLKRLFNKKLAGGSLLDVGIYPVYLSLLLLGLPKEIKAMARMTKTGVDSYCAMLLDYEKDEKAFLESGIEANTPTQAYIYGDKGSLKMHRQFHHAEKISLILNHGEEEVFDLPYKGNGFYHEIEEVSHCLIEGKNESSKHPLSASIELITVLDRIKQEIGLKYET